MVQIKGMSKPEHCERCYMAKFICLKPGATVSSMNVRCDLLKRTFDVDVLKEGNHQPVPDDCPITETEE